jgi:hypothetical protein
VEGLIMKEDPQARLCERVGVRCVPVNAASTAGVSRATMQEGWPLNGMRVPVVGDSSGWFVWSGKELSTEPDFFEPRHVRHLVERRPEVEQSLGLPPGYRFLIAPDYEDVWFDSALLEPPRL